MKAEEQFSTPEILKEDLKTCKDAKSKLDDKVTLLENKIAAFKNAIEEREENKERSEMSFLKYLKSLLSD